MLIMPIAARVQSCLAPCKSKADMKLIAGNSTPGTSMPATAAAEPIANAAASSSVQGAKFEEMKAQGRRRRRETQGPQSSFTDVVSQI